MSMRLNCSGVDIVSIARMDKALKRSGISFLNRIFKGEELQRVEDKGFMATRFAAKEAFFKALGTGISEGVKWHDFILPPSDQLSLTPRITGKSRILLGGRNVFVSVSRTDTTAIAVVMIEKTGGEV